jgi:hypothetical protein
MAPAAHARRVVRRGHRRLGVAIGRNSDDCDFTVVHDDATAAGMMKMMYEELVRRA